MRRFLAKKIEFPPHEKGVYTDKERESSVFIANGKNIFSIQNLRRTSNKSFSKINVVKRENGADLDRGDVIFTRSKLDCNLNWSTMDCTQFVFVD